MKKLVLVGFAAVLCVSCIASPDDQPVQSAPVSNVATDVDMSQVYTYEPGYEEGEVVEQPVRQDVKDANFYRQHILVKGMGDDYIIYEYSDVRVDQVATLASRYCYDKDSRTSAYLRDVYMRKNRKRRATFDCIIIANE